MSEERNPSIWAAIPRLHKMLVAIVAIFIAGTGFGFQILQVTAMPEKLQANEIVLAEHQEQLNALREATVMNARSIAILVCLHQMEANQGDPTDCAFTP